MPMLPEDDVVRSKTAPKRPVREFNEQNTNTKTGKAKAPGSKLGKAGRFVGKSFVPTALTAATGAGLRMQEDRSVKNIEDRGGFAKSTTLDALDTLGASKVAQGAGALGGFVGGVVTAPWGDKFRRGVEDAGEAWDKVGRQNEMFESRKFDRDILEGGSASTSSEADAPEAEDAGVIIDKADLDSLRANLDNMNRQTNIVRSGLSDRDVAATQVAPAGGSVEAFNGAGLAVRDAQGGIGSLNFDSPEAYAAAQQQTGGDPLLQATGGTVSTVGSEFFTGGQGAPSAEIVQAAREAIARGEDVDIQALFGAKGQQDVLGDEITNLEEKLAAPGRGLNQTAAEFREEQRNRKVMKDRLKSLREMQKTEYVQNRQDARTQYSTDVADRRAATTAARADQRAAQAQANADRTQAWNEMKFIYEKGAAATKEEQTRADKLFADARGIHTEFAKDKYPDDPELQQIYVANQLETYLPKGGYETPESRGMRATAKKALAKYVKSERGLVDFVFGGKAPTQEELDKIDFSNWEVDPQGGAAVWPFANAVIRDKNNESNYAYLDNMPDEVRTMLLRLIEADKPKKTVRKGQK